MNNKLELVPEFRRTDAPLASRRWCVPQMKALFRFAILLGLFLGSIASVRAQDAAPPEAPDYQPLSDGQLDKILGPIALYPDPLLAEILPAATFPAQIVLADRYLAVGGDPDQIAAQPWDPSVQAMAHYPVVLKWMDDNLEETTQLGEAYLNQPAAVIASIQRLRMQAFNRGNLLSTQQQQVTNDDGTIEINSVDDQDVYVPSYNSDQVYADDPDGTPYVTFGQAYPLGDWLDTDFDWDGGGIVVWNPDYTRPPDWWRGHRHHDPGTTRPWHPRNSSQGVLVHSTDRGWLNAPSAEVMRHELSPQVPSHEARIYSPSQFAPGPTLIHHQELFRPPEADGALIGVQSSRDTRSYSERGLQSMHEMGVPQVVPHFAPAPAMYGGHAGGFGGGGGRAGGFGGGGGGRR